LTSDHPRSTVSDNFDNASPIDLSFGRLMVVFCSGCGNNVPVGERFCAVCGKEVSAASAPAPAFGPPAEGTIFPAQTSGKAIACLVCGLFLFAFPLSILAVIFGHLSVSEIRKSSGRLKGEGIATAGLVLGYVGLAVIPLILIIAAIAIPNLLRARMAGNESSAVASIRTLGAAEVQYFSAPGGRLYLQAFRSGCQWIDRLAIGHRGEEWIRL
jgi:hypothetical protein